MDELFELCDAMFDEFGEDVVRDIADNCEFSVDIVPDMLDDESVLEMFAEMVRFIVEELATINKEKAKAVLLLSDISEEIVDELLDSL